jgi:integrase
LALFLEEKAKNRRPSTTGEYRRVLQKLPFSRLDEIDHAAITRVLRGYGARYEYNKTLVCLKIFLNWCRKRRYIEHNPADGFSRHATHARSHVLKDDEARVIFEAVSHDPTPFKKIIALCLLTGMRRGEAAAMHSSWVNEAERTITIPATVAKNGRACEIPYGDLAARFIPNTTGHLFLSRNGVPYTKFAKAKAKLDKECGVSGWKIHDLRRFYRTAHGRIGTRPDLAERLINHVSSRSPVEAVYDRYSYLPEMREPVTRYERFILGLLESAPKPAPKQ